MDIINSQGSEAESFQEGSDIEIGQWYWVKSNNKRWLGCLVHIGSNFVELESPRCDRRGWHSSRVLFTEMEDTLTLEPNAREVIQNNIDEAKTRVENGLAKVKEITSRLGVSSKIGIEHKDSNNRSLAILSDAPDINGYKKSLIKAKEVDLPEAFEEIKNANQDLARWMSAESVPMLAMANKVRDCVEDIEDRIFNVSLYAGLTEDIHQVSDGEPADFNEPLYLMQRRLYMDEECLLNYRHGGMEFKNIKQFDKWLTKKSNLDRIFPFQRCMVAFRVRRDAKKRDWGGKLRQLFIDIQVAGSDKYTFLYIRNGKRIYRMDCDLEFGEFIFPNKSEFDPSEPMMVRMFANSVSDMMSLREYEDRKKEWEIVEKQIKKERAIREKWLKEVLGPPPERSDYPDTSAGRERYYHDHNEVWRQKYNECPFGGYFHHTRHDSFDPGDWEPINQDNVYFDECVEEIDKRIKQYNRIALIIQGLFDRSECLHPHPPVKIWDPASFNRSIVMVYDGSNILHYGEAPDFEEYRQAGLEKLNRNSVVIGQDGVWAKKEADKENNRLDNDWRNTSDYRHEYLRPHGNPGPGYIAKMYAWRPKVRQAVFSWNRECANWRDDRLIRTTLTVEADNLFNVSAYTPGDYKRFFEDPRTRADYLQWAPMLLAAEEFYAGNMEAQEPI